MNALVVVDLRRACAAVNPLVPTVPTPAKFTPLKIWSINGTLSWPARTALNAVRRPFSWTLTSLI